MTDVMKTEAFKDEFMELANKVKKPCEAAYSSVLDLKKNLPNLKEMEDGMRLRYIIQKCGRNNNLCKMIYLAEDEEGDAIKYHEAYDNINDEVIDEIMSKTTSGIVVYEGIYRVYYVLYKDEADTLEYYTKNLLKTANQFKEFVDKYADEDSDEYETKNEYPIVKYKIDEDTCITLNDDFMTLTPRNTMNACDCEYGISTFNTETNGCVIAAANTVWMYITD